MKPSKLTILKTIGLLCIIHAANAQQTNERGGPIRGALIKGGRNPSGDVVVQARTKNANGKKEIIPTWYYLDAGTSFMGAAAKNDLRLNSGIAFNLGATIPFNQIIGLTINGGISSFGNNNNLNTGIQNIKYTDGAGGVKTIESNTLKKSEALSFNLLAGPNLYKNIGRFYIQPGILFGMNHLNHKGFELGEGTNFIPSPGENVVIKTYQVNEFSKTSFALRPDFKFGYLLFRNVALQAAVAYTYIPNINYSTTTFIPAYNPDPNGVHEFQSLKNGTYKSTNQTVNFSSWNISLGLTFTFNSKHAINTKGTGAQNNRTSGGGNNLEIKTNSPSDKSGRGKVKNIKVDPVSAKTNGGDNNPASQGDTSTNSSIVPVVQQHAINTKGTGAQNNRTTGGDNNPASQGDTSTNSSIVPVVQQHAINTKGTGAQNNRTSGGGNNPASQGDTSTNSSIVPVVQQHAINTKGTGAQNNRTSGAGNNPEIKTNSPSDKSGRGKVKNIKVDPVSAKTTEGGNNPASQVDTSTNSSIVPVKQQHAINTKGTGAQNNRTSGGGNNPASQGDTTTNSSIVPVVQQHAINTKGTGAANNRTSGGGNNPASQGDTSTNSSIFPVKQQHAINTKGTGAQNNRTSGSGNNPASKGDTSTNSSIVPVKQQHAINTKGTGAQNN